MKLVVTNVLDRGFEMDRFARYDADVSIGKPTVSDLGNNRLRVEADIHGDPPYALIRGYFYADTHRTTVQSMVYLNDQKQVLLAMNGINYTLSGANDDFFTDPFAMFHGNDRIFGNLHGDDLRGFRGDDGIYGEDGRDSLFGGPGHDHLHGQMGSDRIVGGKGNDRAWGGDGWDTLSGGQGRDQLSGGLHNDRLNGGGGRDRLSGGNGNDQLTGGAANDTLDGGKGRDDLSGGAGADRFLFKPGDGRDTIEDFVPGVDKIEIVKGAASLADVTFAQAGDDVVLRFADVRVAVEDVTLAALQDDGNFVF